MIIYQNPEFCLRCENSLLEGMAVPLIKKTRLNGTKQLLRRGDSFLLLLVKRRR